jgi:hypothetical protein
MLARSKLGTSIVENTSSARTLPSTFASETLSTDGELPCHEDQRTEFALSRLWSWRKTFLSLDSLLLPRWSEEFNVYELPFLIAFDMFWDDNEPVGLDKAAEDACT